MAEGLLSGRVRFGRFTLDPQRAELLRDGVEVPLRPKPFALLSVLASRPGRVLSKEELLQTVWPGVVVTDDSLTQCVHELRSALGEEGTGWLRTVPRRGYRFDAPVGPDPPAEHATADPETAAIATATAMAATATAATATPVVVPSRPGAARERALAAFGAVVTLAMLAGLVAAVAVRPNLDSVGPPRSQSIVVLPLTRAGIGDDMDWFAQALTADMTGQLARMPGMLVISRETAFTYRGKPADPRRVARDLGVRYVLQGTVGRKDTQVRLNLAMVDGDTGAHRWAGQFDIDRAALDDAVDDVAKRVARSLNVETIRADAQRSATRPVRDLEADDLAMQGFGVYFRGYTPENLREAARIFEAAVAKDPASVRAWGGVAVMNGLLASIEWAPDRRAALARLEQASERLQQLDQDHYYTYAARSNLANLRGDYESWLLLADDAIGRFPSHPSPHGARGLALMNLGRFDECVEPAKRALRLGPRDPLAALWHWQIGTCHFMRAEYREAARFARTAQEINPRLPLPPLLLAAALWRDGGQDEARAIVDDYRRRHPDYRVDDLNKLMRSREPRYAEGRGRLAASLRELGLP